VSAYKVQKQIIYSNNPHLSDEALELYTLGKIADEAYLAQVEEHLLACRSCLNRAQADADYTEAMRKALSSADLSEAVRNPAKSRVSSNASRV
jgi:hypothetical protein